MPVTELTCTEVETPLGALRLVADNDALIAVLWPDDPAGRVRFEHEPVGDDGTHPVLEAAARQLAEYFAGTRQHFDLPIDLRGTDFQQAVWSSLADIPYAQTATYGEQAATIGRPTAVRAVGAANGRNPLSIVLPCHRVVGATGALTGFAGGIDAKRWLLDHEARTAHR